MHNFYVYLNKRSGEYQITVLQIRVRPIFTHSGEYLSLT